MLRNLLALLVIFIISSNYYSQTIQQNELLNSAIEQINNGRFGEAIDFLNKFIASNPRVADGYNLRGFCFENRSEFRDAVFDYRRAIKIEPDNREIRANLDRVTAIWHSQLYDNIEGYQRQIAVNANDPDNYLEIARIYKDLELWELSEEWYDKYLSMIDMTSADEMIRYTEVLAQINHIAKGEKILEKYVEANPTDWRLWSRYGFFLLWLGKHKNAETAFLKSLEIKPFFKEAEDGLDQARREGYLTREPKVYRKEFPIDRYYRVLKNQPDNDEIRFKLVDELIKYARHEEAYSHLLILRDNYSEDARFKRQWDVVNDYRENQYRNELERNLIRLSVDPSNTVIAKEIAQAYVKLDQSDKAFDFLNRFFLSDPNITDNELIYLYAKIAAENKDFDLAVELSNRLLANSPDNLDYQLLRAQIAVWTSKDLYQARNLLENILANDPKNLNALILMSSLNAYEYHFDEALDYARMAKSIAPKNPDVLMLFSNIEIQKKRAREEELYAILEEGRSLVRKDDCASALNYYDQYLDKADDVGDAVVKEYGDVNVCAKRYDKALAIYNEILARQYDIPTAISKAQLLTQLDSAGAAIAIYNDILKHDENNFNSRIALVDLFTREGEYDSARTNLSYLMSMELDSLQRTQVEARRKWLPPSKLSEILESIPSSVAFIPSASFYSDDLSLRFAKIGGRLEIGIIPSLSLGVSFDRTILSSDIERRDFSIFKGHILARFLGNFSAGLSTGKINSTGISPMYETDAYLRYQPNENLSIQGIYVRSDAGLLLYSPFLVERRYDANLFRAEGFYMHRTGIKLSGMYQYVKVNEDNLFYGENAGNAVQIRIGKKFLQDFEAGYEYHYLNFKYNSDYYWSPFDFVSHSLWGLWYLEDFEELKLKIGGKLGYIPSNNFVLYELNGQAQYVILSNLSMAANAGVGSTTRFDSSYNYFSASLSFYWGIF